MSLFAQKRVWLVVLLCAGATRAAAVDSIVQDSVNISGQVVDAAGGGINGAIVAILGDARLDTTDLFGDFSFHYQRDAQAVAFTPHPERIDRPSVRFGDARMIFNLPSNSSNIEVSLFNGSGCRLMQCVFHGMTAGMHSVSMGTLGKRRMAPGIYVAQVSIDGVCVQGTIFVTTQETMTASRLTFPDRAGCSDSYKVYEKTSGGYLSLDSVSIVGTTALIDLSEGCGGTFTFVVAAWNRLGESAYSNEFLVATGQQ